MAGTFPVVSAPSAAQAETILINKGASAGLAMPSGGLSLMDFMAWGLGEILGGNLPLSSAGEVNITNTITSATPSTQRLVRAEVTLTPATTMAIGSGGSIAGVRGAITVTTGKTFTEGFLYGVQGKVTLNGTMNEGSAARIAGALGQVDLAAGTLTDGQVSCLWADLQGGTGTLSDVSQLNILRLTNSSSATPNAVIMCYGEATNFMTTAKDGGAPAYFITTAPTSLAKSLRITVAGTNYYIGLYSAAS